MMATTQPAPELSFVVAGVVVTIVSAIVSNQLIDTPLIVRRILLTIDELFARALGNNYRFIFFY